MNRDDIIRMAREVNFTWAMSSSDIAFLEAFAALVAAHEREECARVCEDSILAENYLTLSEIAAAIRESPVQAIYDSMRARSNHGS